MDSGRNPNSVLQGHYPELPPTNEDSRMINVIMLLDCGFLFFSNYPCRFAMTEMKFDLPCEDYLFSSLHPFHDPRFTASRNMTTREAFKTLFAVERPSFGDSTGIKNNPHGLTPLDMFIMIHRTLAPIYFGVIT